MAQKQETFGWVLLALIGALLLWLFKGGASPFLHATVSGGIVFPPQANTGIPQYDSGNPATLPDAAVQIYGPKAPPVAPVGSVMEGITSHPAHPELASCPAGYRLWYDLGTGSYACWPAYGDAAPVTGSVMAGGYPVEG